MDVARIPEIEQVLKTLGNAARLRLLIALQQPRKLADIYLETEGRPMSRQAVKKHITSLEDVGLVSQLADGSFLIRHARMYEVVERLRTLAQVRASVDLEDMTRVLDEDPQFLRPKAPHLVTVHGVAEGQTFVLSEPDDESGWTLGRKGDMQLDHDQFVSSRHARILRRDNDYYLLDLATNRNGTTLNWRAMEKGGLAKLHPGDIIGIGMTRLVFRPGSTEGKELDHAPVVKARVAKKSK